MTSCCQNAHEAVIRKVAGGETRRWQQLFVRIKLLLFATVLGFLLLFLFPQGRASAQTTVCLPIGGFVFCKTLPPRYYYPPAPAFPSEMTQDASWNFDPNPDGTYNLDFMFNNPNSRQVSISLNSAYGADPGPDPDTRGSQWTFTEVPANSTQYVNMKAGVNGLWSLIEVWTISVPEWVAPTPTPTPISSLPPSQGDLTQSSSSSGGGGIMILLFIILLFILVASYGRIKQLFSDYKIGVIKKKKKN